MLKVANLSVAFDGKPIITDLSFEVPTATTLAITGPSGVGKSTVLQAICGLVRISSGVISVDNHVITQLPTHKRGIVMVTQSNDLFPHLTVSQNIAFGLRMRGSSSKDTSQRVQEMLDVVGLPDFAERDIHTLSGGEARRISLARALAPSPRVLLLDEPFTGLDEETHASLIRQVQTILISSCVTAILVTHDQSEADFLSSSSLTLMS